METTGNRPLIFMVKTITKPARVRRYIAKNNTRLCKFLLPETDKSPARTLPALQ